MGASSQTGNYKYWIERRVCYTNKSTQNPLALFSFFKSTKKINSNCSFFVKQRSWFSLFFFLKSTKKTNAKRFFLCIFRCFLQVLLTFTTAMSTCYCLGTLQKRLIENNNNNVQDFVTRLTIADVLLHRINNNTPRQALHEQLPSNDQKHNGLISMANAAPRKYHGRDTLTKLVKRNSANCDAVCTHCRSKAAYSVSALCGSECHWGGESFNACLTLWFLAGQP